MVIGNIQAQEALKIYFDKIQELGTVSFPFLLVDGPQYVGKKTVIEDHLKHLLGDFFATDYMPLYDLSDILWKKHSLKVEVSAKEQQIEHNGKLYPNLWARDLVHRFSLSSMGKIKVIFLENIERMTIGATNAFLKTLEEPLPWRLIVATTINKERLLDTILSRAFIVSFQTSSLSDIEQYLQKWYPEKDETMRTFAARFSLGRVGLARKLLDANGEWEERAQLFESLLKILQRDEENIVEKYQILKQFAERGQSEQLIDAVLYSFSDNQQIWKMRSWFHARKLLRSNVGEDNILFGLALG